MPSRKFIAKGPQLYGRFLCGDCQWVELDQAADLEWVYADGYLPFSGDPKSPRHLFYMSRSLRVDLSQFGMDKKRRYDHRQWISHGLVRSLMTKDAFLEAHASLATELAYKWMKPRFGEAALSLKRFKYILSKPFLDHVMTWHHGNELVAFAFIVSGNWGAHYWYAFYKNDPDVEFAPGHGYMADFINWAQSNGVPFAYLGTSYGMKSRYKSRGIRGIEFWDENAWSSDKERLSTLLNDDDEIPVGGHRAPISRSTS